MTVHYMSVMNTGKMTVMVQGMNWMTVCYMSVMNTGIMTVVS